MKDRRTTLEQWQAVEVELHALRAAVFEALHVQDAVEWLTRVLAVPTDVLTEAVALLVHRPRMFYVFEPSLDGTPDYGETVVVLARTPAEACAKLLQHRRYPAADSYEPRPDPVTNAWMARQANMRHNAKVEKMAAALVAVGGDYAAVQTTDVVWGELS